MNFNFKSILSLAAFTLLLIFFKSCSTEPTPVYTLSSSVEPAEAGVLEKSSVEAKEGTSINVSAIANEHWTFSHWSGDLTGTVEPTVNVFMDRDRHLVAKFERTEYPLTVHINGEGAVLQEIISQKSETNDYLYSSVVQLKANPDYGWVFAGWSGDLDSDESEVQVEIEGPLEITATFERQDFALTVNIEGKGSVEQELVQSVVTDYSFESLVQLTATPDNDWVFNGWSGDVESSDSSVIIEIDEEKTVTASFITTPSLSINQATNVTENSASVTANISNDGRATVTNRGMCISTSSDGVENLDCQNIGSGTGSFTRQFTNLSSGTTYYVAAFADNAAGQTVSEQISFTTVKPITRPTVTTTSISGVSENSAVSGGNITNDGGSAVTVKGLCWNSSPGASLENNIQCTQQGSGSNAFTTNMSGLVPSTDYWVRAYATNSAGTSYGSELNFSTLASTSPTPPADDETPPADDETPTQPSSPPPPISPPPPPPPGSGNTTLLIMFSPATLANSGTATGAVDVNVNGTWYNFSSSFPVNSSLADVGHGVVLQIDAPVIYLAVRPEQVRKAGLNNDCYGFTTLKLMQKHPDFNAFSINGDPNSPSFWAGTYDGAGELVERGSVNYLVDKSDPNFFQRYLPNSWTSSGKFMLWVDGVGVNHGGYLNFNTLLGAPGLFPTGRTTALPGCQ